MSNEQRIAIENYVFKKSVKIQKRFSDLDPFAHANNVAQQNYFDIGRADYLGNLIDFKPFHLAPETLLVVSYKTDFIAPILPSDEIEVQTSIYHIGNKSIKMLQVTRNIATGVIHSVCDSVMVAVSIHDGVPSSIAIPEEWRRRISEIER
ncbi:MAG: hotdog domain-containing protein [Bacteroidia bacterium]|nr:hotdog domain-containing protein [Bacteroidia bacterium]